MISENRASAEHARHLIGCFSAGVQSSTTQCPPSHSLNELHDIPVQVDQQAASLGVAHQQRRGEPRLLRLNAAQPRLGGNTGSGVREGVVNGRSGSSRGPIVPRPPGVSPPIAHLVPQRLKLHQRPRHTVVGLDDLGNEIAREGRQVGRGMVVTGQASPAAAQAVKTASHPMAQLQRAPCATPSAP